MLCGRVRSAWNGVDSLLLRRDDTDMALRERDDGLIRTCVAVQVHELEDFLVAKVVGQHQLNRRNEGYQHGLLPSRS